MPDKSTQSITIDADAASVMAVIADFPRYPDWAGSIKEVEVVEQGADGRAARARFRLDTTVIKDTYVLSYAWTGDERVEWDLVESQMQKAQHGSYTLAGRGASTEVTYELTVDLAVPMLGMLKRKVERVVMDTALKELKKRVESGAA